MKAAVIVFPGSNCDRDVAVALHQATGTWPDMVWHKDSSFEKCDLIVLPGGFSFGDYLRGGAMAARAPVMREVVARAAQGVPILGICNGFQILTEAGLLPGALMRNQELKFVCKMTTLRIENNQSAFTAGYTQGEVVHMPVAHGEGNYRADTATLEELEAQARVVFRYADADGTASETANPNGSCTNIAGIVNDAGNVLGMMPHPERVIGDELGGADGARMFAGLVGALA